jgi:uncharacterized protein YciW
MKAAIRETRNRLAAQVTQTADYVHLLFTAPSSVDTEAPVAGVVAGAIKANRRRRPYQARLDRRAENGPLAPAAIAGAIVGIAGLLAVRTRRR